MERVARLMLLGISLCWVVAARAQDKLRNVPSTDPQVEKAAFHVAEGYEINLFAAEPMVVKPIQMNWDEKGRLWVVGSTSYPQLKPGQEPRDKIYVLEDTDGDGRADQSTVIADSLVTPTGLAPGDGGVYVANSTEVLHLADTDGDGKADQRRVVLSGFGQDDTHHLIHTFRWGPASRLYLNQSIYIYSHVETPWGVERLEGGGIWRFKPRSLKLDVFARGLINPWGHQFNRWGQSFATDGAGRQGINFVFPDAAFVAAKGAERTIEGLNPGQPKHAGLEILSGRHFPDSLQGHMVTNDFRANTINRFVVTEDGSGYASRQASDLVWTDHVAFRPVDVRMGPDGALYVADWYNPIIQHGEVDFRDPRRDHKHGRIWRITAKDRPLVDRPKLAGASARELLAALKQPEAWTRNQAKRLLKERGSEAVLPKLKAWVASIDRGAPRAAHHLLEGLWVYQSLNVFDTPLLEELLESEDHRARAAAVRVLYHGYDSVAGAEAHLEAAVRDSHPRVRREAVTALQKWKDPQAAKAALAALEQPMDRFLDFALWHTVRELKPQWLPRLKQDPDFLGGPRKTVFALKAIGDPAAAARLAALYQAGDVPPDYAPEVLSAIAGRGGEDELKVLFGQAMEGAVVSGNDRLAHLEALEEAARSGKRPAGKLAAVEELLDAESTSVRAAAARLMGHWNLTQARGRLEQLAQDDQQDPDLRAAALEGIALFGGRESKDMLEETARSEKLPAALRMKALEQLVPMDVDRAANVAAGLLPAEALQAEREGIFEAFFSQSGGVAALTETLQKHSIPAGAAKAGMRVVERRGERWLKANAEAPRLKALLSDAGGDLPPPKMKQDLSEREVNRLIEAVKGTAEAGRGEAIYRRKALQCTRCHAIGGAGGQVGPSLSSIGASAPTDYLIESLLHPNKAVKDGYSLLTVTKKDGSVVSGIAVRKTDSEVVLRNAADQEVTIPTQQIEETRVQPGSVMPPGLTAQLERQEFVDLVGFLSKLGDEEAFSVPEAVTYVRRWRVLGDTEAARTALAEEGPRTAVEEGGGGSWQPAYSTVDGALPLEEVPALPVGTSEVSLVRFALDVEEAGRVTLAFENPQGLSLWRGAQQVAPVEKKASLELGAGTHRLVLSVNRGEREETSLRVHLVDEETTAQVSIVAGK